MRGREPLHPWLRPLWRRLLIVLFCAVWAGLEAWHQPGSLWFWMVLALSGYGILHLFVLPARDEPGRS